MRKSIYLGTSLLLICALLFACAPTATPTAPAADKSAAPTPNASEVPASYPRTPEKAPRIVVIANRSFGDKGPIDSQIEGLEYAKSLGFETKSLESLSPDVFEEDIRAMAEEGYDIIVTSFPPVQVAMESVAKDFPNIKFVGIYEFTNAGDSKMPNIWSVEYKSQEMMYALGAFHAKLTKSNKIGIISGQETASSNGGINGFMEGVVATNPGCSVEFAFANSYDDPAKGKEIALAMISRGVDSICLTAGKSSVGAIEACAEADIYVTADNGDFFSLAPKNLPTHLLTHFGQVIKMAADDFKAGTFKGGEHTIMSIFNGGSIVVWDTIDRFIKENPDKKDAIEAAVAYAKEIEQKVIGGEIVIESNPNTPANIKGAG